MPFTIGNRDLTNVSGIRLVVRGQISLIHSSSHAPILFANKWLWYLWNICNQSFIKYFSYAVATIMLLSWDHHFESFTVPTMTWLTVAEYLSQMTTDMFHSSGAFFTVLSSFMSYHCLCTTTVVISGTGTAYPSGAHEFTPGL